MPGPAVNDNVRVRLIGTVTASDAATFTVQTQASNSVIFPATADQAIKWDVLAAPEPEYVIGAFYRDANSAVFIRNQTEFPGDAWIVARHPTVHMGDFVHYSFPTRPLVRLVPQA